ncbi:MAG TPA: cyclic 2,3-diphosphoglycerate synthase [Acidobacteriota bacterium]
MAGKRVLIMGAAGRDFHNFNLLYRSDSSVEVVAFTATQIPNIEGRRYPAALAGPRYPQGIPIYPEAELYSLIKSLKVDEVLFAYSDVSHEYIMHRASLVLAAGADFRLAAPRVTMVRSKVPVVSVCAVRTGCGKSQTTRRICELLRAAGRTIVVVRHPMPYGDLAAQAVQRFASFEDLDRHNCTIEEREEYEPHLREGTVVFAGVDYEAILRQAEQEADIVLWDGGNNDTPFYVPDLEIVVVDPHRPGHELRYHPGETNLRRADVIVINKMVGARREAIAEVRRNIVHHNPAAIVVEAASPLLVEDGDKLRGQRAVVVEDGPTLTHGEMKYGAGVFAAEKYGATIVDPRPFVVGSIAETFEHYPGIGPVLPAMGYGEAQVHDLETTLKRAECDVVIVATPIDLRRILEFNKPAVRVLYELQEIGRPNLADVLKPFLGPARS